MKDHSRIRWVILLLCCAFAHAQQTTIQITLDTDTIGMGETVLVSVNVIGTVPPVLYPYVDGYLWGAETTMKTNTTVVILPLPNIGKFKIQLAAHAQPKGAFWVGSPLPSNALVSNGVQVTVTPRQIINPFKDPRRTIVMEWEPWLTPMNANYQTAEAVPLVGRYNSYNRNASKQHAIWMIEAGVGALIVDWTNNLWGDSHWSQHGPNIQELIDATTINIGFYNEFLKEGLPVPKFVLLLGLDNGPNTSMIAINEEIAYAFDSYYNNASYSKDLWLNYKGKPLLSIFDGGDVHSKLIPANDTYFTVRWMSSQLQINRYDRKGYWSWMDGLLSPIPTPDGNGGYEALTVTVAYFAGGGWLYPAARSRMDGTTFVEQYKAALAYLPTFLVICQWNEFAGQPESDGGGPKHDQFADSYNVPLSNDIEPTSLSECAYSSSRPNSYCGGWGFYYLNLHRALNAIYAQAAAPTFSVLTMSSPPQKNAVVSGNSMLVSWSIIGLTPKSYQIKIDDKIVATVDPTKTSASIDISQVPKGAHVLDLEAVGTQTFYELSYVKVDKISKDPLPVHSSASFVIV